MQNHPSISVLIAAKDASATIYHSVASALRQPEVGEVIVVDDGSKDATAAAAAVADDCSGRLHIHRMELNQGPSAARNRAMKETQADLICVLDADDRLTDGRFSRMLNNTGSDWDMLADDLLIASEATPDFPDRCLVGLANGSTRRLGIVGFVQSNIADPRHPRRELGYLKPLIRRTFLERSGINYDETLRLGEDYALYARALLWGARFLLIPACGYIAVQRKGSLSHLHGVQELAALVDADHRLVEEARVRYPGAVAALESHCRSVRRNLDHRLMLNAKKQRNWPTVAKHLLRTPATTFYIIETTIRAKMNDID